MQIIEPADAEQAVIDELAGYATIGTRVPDPAPAEFMRVTRVGGSQRNLMTDTPLLALEAFAKTESRAVAILAGAIARVEAAVREGRLGNETASATNTVLSSGPQNYPLPSLPSHRRYTATIAPDLRRRVTTI